MTQAVYPDPSVVVSLPYATPATPRVGPRAWAGAAILAAGVFLVGLGGCFLIGVLGIVGTVANGMNGPIAPPGSLTGPQVGLMVVLYILAFACFAGAATLLFLGSRALLRIMRG
jgi:hypothetical protein